MRGATLRLTGLALVAMMAAAPGARAEGRVELGSGGVSVTARADARCSDPVGGDVEAPFAGDDTLPYAAAVIADVNVPCQHGGTPDEHTARGEASASGEATAGAQGAVISGEGSTDALGHHLHQADAFTEFNQAFTVVDGAMAYSLAASGGRVELDGAAVTSGDGVLQPGGHTLRAFAQCNAGLSEDGCGGAGFSVSLAIRDDTDGDGLLDEWETDGTPDGLDLPAMGADPRHKDIFVELDHMSGHALDQGALDSVVAAFEDAPVGNPDGVDGIALHIDNGPASPMDGTQTWGASSRAEELEHEFVLGFISGRDYDWTEVDLIKDDHFEAAREPVFHYAISGHRIGSSSLSSSGIARDIPGGDFLVTLGAAGEPGESSSTPQRQAGTFMHELGHTLGLRHGGADHSNYNPNHLSVMNYMFQFTWLPRVDGTDVLGYSTLPVELDERALDEGAGFGYAAGTPQAASLTQYRCPDRSRRWAHLQAARIDWNCDGTTAGTISRDLNGDTVATARPPYLEWPELVYDGGPIGGGGEALPDRTEAIEPPLEELVESETSLAAFLAPAPPPRGAEAGPTVPPPGGGAAQADLAPVLGGLTVRPRAFRAGRRGASLLRRGGPAALRLRASRAGLVRFTVQRRALGRRAGGRCRAARRGRRCVRFLPLRGSFTTSVPAGASTLRFSGRLAGRALPAGRYRLVATPLSARTRAPGAVRRAEFRILRPRRS